MQTSVKANLENNQPEMFYCALIKLLKRLKQTNICSRKYFLIKSECHSNSDLNIHSHKDRMKMSRLDQNNGSSYLEIKLHTST